MHRENTLTHTRLVKNVIAVCLLGILLILGCSRSNGELRSTMRSVYATTASLFRLAWRPTEFKDPKNEKRIKNSLESLIQSFHTVEGASEAYQREPCFLVTLNTHEAALRDISARFTDGKKDYAIWKLRALTSNCIACHSRYQVSTDFIGDEPIPVDASFSSKLAAAEFLIATRQFDRADKDLYELARTIVSLPGGSTDAIEALELWLLIEVRVKNRPLRAAERLEQYLNEAAPSPEVRDTIQAWRSDLLEIGAQQDGLDGVQKARKLLHEVAGNVTIDQDKARLVPTLYASALLHSLLQSELDSATRREALYLLAVAYAHLPISSLEYFSELYLEQCIREFPGTEESKKSYSILESLIEFKSSGSSGVHVDPADAQLLKELKALSKE